MEEKDNIAKYKEELATLKTKISETTSDIDIWRMERETDTIEKKIKSIEDGTELMDYYLRTGDILYNYYDIQDKIQQGNHNFYSNKAKPGSILAILEKVANDEDNDVNCNTTSSMNLSASEKSSTTTISSEKRVYNATNFSMIIYS